MRMSSRAVGWVVAAAATLLLVVVAAVVVRPLLSPSNRLPIGGRPYFWAGVNYPWRTYQDFGTGAWGHSGISNPTTKAEVDTDLSNATARGVRVVKWRIFNDTRYSPEFDENGSVTGLDEEFFADVDSALELIAKHDMYVVFTLFASGMWTTSCSREGVQLGGRADVIGDNQKRRSLVEKAVIPLLKHVGHNPRVLAYEIIAEPEWGVAELNRDDDGRIKVPHGATRALVKDVARAIHQYTGSLATVESNRSRYMREWQGLDLDFYSFSWYDWLEPYDPLDQPASKYGLDRPVVIGEFPMADSQYYDLTQVLEIAYRQGYAGAFGWSYWGGDTYGQFNQVADSYVAWISGHWPEVDLGRWETILPNLSAPLRPPPYEASVRQLIGSDDWVNLEVEVQVQQKGAYQLQFLLQEAGDHPVEGQVEQKAIFDENGRRRFRISFYGLTEDRTYKVNLAIFDASWQMRKWFDGLTVVQLKNGTLAPAELSVQALEDPCYKPERPSGDDTSR